MGGLGLDSRPKLASLGRLLLLCSFSPAPSIWARSVAKLLFRNSLARSSIEVWGSVACKKKNENCSGSKDFADMRGLLGCGRSHYRQSITKVTRSADEQHPLWGNFPQVQMPRQSGLLLGGMDRLFGWKGSQKVFASEPICSWSIFFPVQKN